MNNLSWATIPHYILVEIYQHLRVNDRLNASQVNKWWSECFHHPQLWSKFLFHFNTDLDKDGSAIECIERYCSELKDVEIFVDQYQKVSRERAYYVIEKLTELEQKKLRHFSFNFTGRNPLCFNGNVILEKLKKLFLKKPNSEILFQVTFIDLNQCNIPFDNELISIFAKHSALRVVRIQNECLVDNVTPSSILEMVKNCKFLEELHTFYHCINKDVITALSEKRDFKLKELSLMCNRGDKFNELIDTASWMTLSNSNPGLSVVVNFHVSMPHHMIIALLCAGMPLVKLNLKVYSWIADELEHIGRTFSSTLEVISFHTGIDETRKAPPGVETSLLDLVSRCTKLTELHCYCSLDPATIEQIKAFANIKKHTLYAA